MKYTVLTLKTVTRYKKSDTLFILGSGPSINSINAEQWKEIARHDSIGFNWWILHEFVPSFYHCEYNRDPVVVGFLSKALEKKRAQYKKTIFFVHSRARKRGMHPRFMPQMFSNNPICCFFDWPPLVRLGEHRPFRKEDFKEGFLYRGSLNVMLYIAYRMKYKNIVLLGVELRTAELFYDNYKEAGWMSHLNYLATANVRSKQMHGTMCPKGERKHSIESVIYALDDFVFKPNHINLFVGTKESSLYPRLPFYAILCDDNKMNKDGISSKEHLLL